MKTGTHTQVPMTTTINKKVPSFEGIFIANDSTLLIGKPSQELDEYAPDVLDGGQFHTFAC